MRNIVVGLVILAVGGWYLSHAQNTPRINGGVSKSGPISGYVKSSGAPIDATKSAAGSIIK